MPDPLEQDESIRAGWTRDARGRTVRMLDPKRLYLLRRYDRINAEDLALIMDDVEPGIRGLKLAIWLIIPIVVLTIGSVLLSSWLEGPAAWRDLLADITSPVMIPILFCSLAGGVIVPVITTWKQRMKRVCWALLKHRYCPHCGYDLRHLPCEPADGATTCPECSCAWRLDVPDHAGPGSGAATADLSKRVLWATIALTGLSVLGVVFMLWFTLR